MMALREDEVRAQTKQAILIEQLVGEVKGLRLDLSNQASDLSRHKEDRAKHEQALALTLANIQHTQTGHTKDIATLFDKHEQKSSAWAGLWPTIIAQMVASLLTTAVMGGILYAAVKGGAQ